MDELLWLEAVEIMLEKVALEMVICRGCTGIYCVQMLHSRVDSLTHVKSCHLRVHSYQVSPSPPRAISACLWPHGTVEFDVYLSIHVTVNREEP